MAMTTAALRVMLPFQLREDGVDTPRRVVDLLGDDSRQLGVVGSWDGWSGFLPFPTAPTSPRSGDDALAVVVPGLPPCAVVQYKFTRADRSEWFSDPSVPVVSNSDGSRNNVAVAEAPVSLVLRPPPLPGRPPLPSSVVACVASCTAWACVCQGRDDVTLTATPGAVAYRLKCGDEWLVNSAHQTVDNGVGGMDNIVNVSAFRAGLENPDARCFLNSAVQALYALQHVRELMWRCTDIVCALRAMDASAAHGGTHAAVQQLLDGQDACIVDAAAAAFRSVADRLSPAACHPLHHFAMEHGWFRSGHADDSVMVTTRLLHHLLMVLQGLQSVSAIGIDSVSVSTGVSASSLEWCMEAHMRCSNARCAATARQSFSLPSPSVVLNGEAGRVVEVATAFDAARSSLWAFGRPACDACGVGSLHVHDCVAVGAATPVVLMHLAAGGFAFDEDVMLDTGDGQFVRYAVRAVVCKSGGVCDGHYVVVCRQDVRDVRGNASIQWWLLDDADVSIVRPSGAPGRLSDDCIFTAFTPCLLACDAMNS